MRCVAIIVLVGFSMIRTGAADPVRPIEPLIVRPNSRSVEFSPNSELLLMGDGALVNLSRKNLLNDFKSVESATFHPNSRLLATLSNSEFALHDIRLKKDLTKVGVKREGSTRDIGPRSVFTPDAKWFLTTGHLDEPDAPKALFIFDMEKRKLARTIPLGTASQAGLAMLPGGKRVVAAAEKLFLIEIESGKIESERALPNQTRWCWCSRDGKTLFVLKNGLGSNDEVLMSSIDGDEPAQVIHTAPKINWATTAPDGNSVFAMDARGVLMRRILPDEPVESIDAHEKESHGMAFTPDEKYLLTGGEDWRLRVWDAATLEPICFLRPARAGVRNIKVSPNGKFVAAVVGSETYVWTMSSILSLSKATP